MNLQEQTNRIKQMMGLIMEYECIHCDERTEKTIKTLLPQLQLIARKFVDEVKNKMGIDIVVASGLRTFEKQDKLYCKGRPNDEYCIKKKLPTAGKIVTNKKGGEGNHNFGRAFDVYLKKNGVIDIHSALNPKIAQIGKDLGLIWGGDWKDFTDMPHFELPK